MSTLECKEAGIVPMDPENGTKRGAIGLRYNTKSLSRPLQWQAARTSGGGHAELPRTKGSVPENEKLDVVIHPNGGLGLW